eukprot:Tbor_TRINITY_DN5957_c3_g2::TRINITY_DN5957_c3_g2_i1::g.19313::m.19313
MYHFFRKYDSMTFISVYRPPTATSSVPTLPPLLPLESLFIGGDFNLHHEAWSSNITPTTCHMKASSLLEWAQNNELCALNDGRPTWKGIYAPDITWYRGEYTAEAWEPIQSHLSDHTMIEVKLNQRPIEATQKLTK